MRMNIIIDDALMDKALVVSGLKTKKEIVDQAIREFIERRARKDLSDLKGRIEFAEGYGYKAAREGTAQ